VTGHPEKHCKGPPKDFEDSWYEQEFHSEHDAVCVSVPEGGRSIDVGCDFLLPKGGE